MPRRTNDPYGPYHHHDPTPGVGGAPSPRGALGLRLGLRLGFAGFGLVACAGFAVVFALLGRPALAGVCVVLAVVALLDTGVVGRRMQVERRTPTPPPT